MDAIRHLGRMLSNSSQTVAFSGAGMSTESGIPDYRSSGGLWSRHRPPRLSEFLAQPEARARYWRLYQEMLPLFLAAKPNPGHMALGRLHGEGRLTAVITQNIDGLHIAGGVPATDVLELHGNLFISSCLACGQGGGSTAELVEEFTASGQPPACPHCGGAVKPCTISFGQNLDGALLRRAARLCSSADVVLVLGSSLRVTPAAELPGLVLAAGGRLVVLNQEATHLDADAEVVVREPAGASLARAVELMER